jgi:hypothetical protein
MRISDKNSGHSSDALGRLVSMRLVLLSVIISILTCIASAGEIREFDIKTLERLGNELIRVSQTTDHGATTPQRQRARQTAIAALKGKLFNIHYDYVVLDDPAGNGFLVYALGNTRKPHEVVLAGHFRLSVSADGGKVNRIDALSHSLMIDNEENSRVPIGTQPVALYCTQIVSDKPVETLIYVSGLSHWPIFVQTPDNKMWQVSNGKMFIDKSKPGTKSTGAASRKAFDELDR